LPRPGDRPKADVVIYDGGCGLCTAGVRRLHGWDRHRRLAFLPLADPEVGRRYPDLKREDLEKELHLVDAHGRVFRAAAALRVLSRRVPRLCWLSPLLHIPGTLWLWNRLYRWVARRRHRLATCRMDPDWPER